MSVIPYTEVNCDAPGDVRGMCGQAYNDVGTGTEVRRRAKAAGWRVSAPGGKDYCPAHRSTSTPGVSR